MNQDTLEELLRRGKDLARQGEREQAHRCFLQATVRDPHSLEAWLWLAGTAETAQEALSSLQRAAELAPSSRRAQRGLEWAQAWLSESAAPGGEPPGPPAMEEALAEVELPEAEPLLSQVNLGAEPEQPEKAQPPAEEPYLVTLSFGDIPPLVAQESTPAVAEAPAQGPVPSGDVETIDWGAIMSDLRSAKGELVPAPAPSLAAGPLRAVPPLPQEESAPGSEEPTEAQLSLPTTGEAQAAEGEGVAAFLAVSRRDLAQGRNASAIERLRGFLHSTPSAHEARELLAEALEKSGQPLDALEEYRLLTELDPGKAAYFAKIGAIYMALGRAEEAIAALRTALHHDQGLAEVHARLAQTLRSQGKKEEALLHWQQVQALAPETAGLRDNLVALYLELEKREEALAALRAVARQRPYDAQVHLSLGKLLLELKRAAAAASEFRTARECEPSLLEARHGLALALEMGGCIGDALSELEKLLAEHPEHVEALETRQRILGKPRVPPPPASAQPGTQEGQEHSRWGLFRRG